MLISLLKKREIKKEIGSSLEASIDIKIGENFSKLIKNLDLPEFFITSKVNLEIDKKLKDEVIVNTKKLKVLNARYVGKLMKLNVLGMGNNLKDKILTNLLPALLIVFTFVIDRVSKFMLLMHYNLVIYL